MDINQIKSAIINGNLTNDDINAVSDALKYARSQLGKEVKRSIRVEFKDSRIGYVHSGSVLKINIKYVQVSTPKGTYRVPANMLTVV